MADRILLPVALDANGAPVAGAVAHFFLAGTTTETVAYTTKDGTTPLGITATADSSGAFPPAYTSVPVKVDIRDSGGVSLPRFPSDNWYVVPSNGVGASSISFTPVDAGVGYRANDASNVQDALRNLVEEFGEYQPLDDQLNAMSSFSPSIVAPSEGQIAVFTSLKSVAAYDVLDEDDMAEDSATGVPTQQSVKAYVDAVADEVSRTWGVSETVSGIAAEFAGIPVGVREIEVVFSGVSTSGTDDILVQLGDAGGVEATGYTSNVEYNGNSDSSTSGFIVARLVADGDTFSGIITLRRVAGNIWVSAGILHNGGWSGGNKGLSDWLDRVRITTSGGTDTFDAGQININYI